VHKGSLRLYGPTVVVTLEVDVIVGTLNVQLVDVTV